MAVIIVVVIVSESRDTIFNRNIDLILTRQRMMILLIHVIIKVDIDSFVDLFLLLELLKFVRRGRLLL